MIVGCIHFCSFFQVFYIFKTYLQECSYRMGKEKRLKGKIIFLDFWGNWEFIWAHSMRVFLAEFERQQHASTILLEDRVNYSVEDIFS